MNHTEDVTKVTVADDCKCGCVRLLVDFDATVLPFAQPKTTGTRVVLGAEDARALVQQLCEALR